MIATATPTARMAYSIELAPEVSRKNERMRFMYASCHTADIVRQRIGKTVKAMIQILGKLLLSPSPLVGWAKARAIHLYPVGQVIARAVPTRSTGRLSTRGHGADAVKLAQTA